MDFEQLIKIVTAIMAFLAIAVPAAVKLSHALGYELPWLTRLADWLAHRPQVYIRRAKLR